MPRETLVAQVQAIQMARAYCLLLGKDPDEIVPGYIRDVEGKRHRVSKARWRWYHGISDRQQMLRSP